MQIGNIREAVQEYFLGTKTHREYRQYTGLAREVIRDSTSLHCILESAAASHYQDIVVGKYTPNALLIIGFVSMYAVGSAGAVFVVAGEALRLTRLKQSSLEDSYQRLLAQLKSETASQTPETECL